MADHSRMKLGKKLRRYDRRTLRLARYLTPSAAPSATRGDEFWKCYGLGDDA
jgi:hypothetical protein